MIPIKLTMQSFGPYRGKEEIDFTKFFNEKLFLISGNTGSGKTMIFDAICYALFGETSGEERKVDTLQSQFSDKTLITYVEFEFCHRDKKYTVTREPEQKKMSRGKEVNHKPTSKLIFDNEVITGIKNVTSKIKEILGIDRSQFKQIVMIAQGEFRKLVSADSKERETIYRRIFDTNNFEKIQNALKERYSKIKNEVEGLSEKIKGHLNSIESIKNISYEELPINEILKILGEEIKVYEKNLEESKSKKEQCLSNIQNQTILFNKAKELVELKEKFSKLNIPQLKKESEYLNKAENTISISEKEENLKNLKMDFNKVRVEKENLLKVLEKQKIDFDIYNKELSDSSNIEERLKSLNNKIFEIENLEPEINEKIKCEKNSLIFKESYEKTNEIKDNICKELEKLNRNKNLKIDFINENKNVTIEISNLKENLNKVHILENNLIKYGETLKFYIDNKNKYEKAIPDYEKILNSYTEKNKELVEKENIYLRNQAGILASKLIDNEPCMVCGSKTHPQKAKLLNGQISEEHIKSIKEEFSKLEEERNEANKKVIDLKNKYEASEESLKEKYEDLVNSHISNFVQFNLFEDGSRCLEKVKEFIENNNLNLNKLNSTVEKIGVYEKEIKESDENINKENRELENIKSKLVDIEKHKELNEKILEEKKRKLLKYNINTRKDYEEILLKFKDENTKLKEKNELLNKNIQKCKESILETETQLKVKSKDIEEFDSKIKVFENNLEEIIKEKGFENFDDYLKYKLSEHELRLRKENIQNKREEFSHLKNNISELTKDLESKQINSKEQIEEILNNTKERLKNIEKVEEGYLKNISLLKSAEKNISTINDKIGQKDEYKNSLNELNKIANGTNKYKISFERYILGIYFKEIIISANIRFLKLTNGRYLFRHSKDKEGNNDMRSQQGLDINVFDNHTSTERKISTLSGGESFKASLSLALGLSDVVQRYSGGISIDTLFIDEGFGSLDSESIQMALECLVDANDKSKLIGIISHVQELKEFIKYKVQIKDSREGSKINLIY